MLAHQPLFQFLGSLIVLLVTDYQPLAGMGAFLLWLFWIYVSIAIKSQPRSDGKSKAPSSAGNGFISNH
jgi:hypothetical protein